MIQIPLGRGGALVEAAFVSRPNRFLIEAELDGALVLAHLADRGRLLETLVPGARLVLARQSAPHRKTAFQAVAAYRGAVLNSLDTHLPNRLIEAALCAAALEPFMSYPTVRREVRLVNSRFDFRLSNAQQHCVVEVKSAGLVLDGVGLFPDAPTERGRRHLEELAGLAGKGERAAVVFVIQGAAQAMQVNQAIDPLFDQALHQAAAAGVEVYAYACPLSQVGIALGPAVPVLGLG
jgi:sugar fermentation stimulation protein A